MVIQISDDKTLEIEKLKEENKILYAAIKENSSDEVLKRIKMMENFYQNHPERFEFKDDDERLRRLNQAHRGLSAFQRFKNAFQRDVDIDPGRLMGLTDGIFGMVMTLLIFGMALPEVAFLNEGDFLSFLISIAPTIGVTLVSFILLASFWLYHHEFIKINNLNIPYLWLNMFYLACISFIPFSTSLIGSYSKFFLSEVIFGINIFLTIIFFLLMFSYANHRGFLEESLSEKDKSYILHTFFIIMGLTVVVNLLDFNVSSNFIYLFFLVPIISTIRDIRYRMGE